MNFLGDQDWLSRNQTDARTIAMIFGNINNNNKTDFFRNGSGVGMEYFKKFDQSEVFKYEISSKFDKFAYTYTTKSQHDSFLEQRAIANFYYCGT